MMMGLAAIKNIGAGKSAVASVTNEIGGAFLARAGCLRPGPVLVSSRAFSRAALSSTPVRWVRWRLSRNASGPYALVNGRRVELEVHSKLQV